MNSVEPQIWPERNWNLKNLGYGPGSFSVILTKKLSNQGLFKTPQGKAALERIKAREKQAIKKGYNIAKSATTKNELNIPVLLLELGTMNSNLNKLRLYAQQKWMRLGGANSLVALTPKNKVGPNGLLTFGNRTYNTMPQYNIWNPNGTRPNRAAMQDLNLIWKAEQLILQRIKNMLAGKNFTERPVWEARRLLSQVKNKNSIIYKNINGKVRKEENSHKESANKRINEGNSLFVLNLVEKDLKSRGHLNSSTHGQDLRTKLNSKKRQVANKEFSSVSNRINKLTSLNLLNHFASIEKKKGALNNPLIGPRIKAKMNSRRKQIQVEKAAEAAAKLAKNTEEAKAKANLNFKTYSGWINSKNTLNGLMITEKMIKNKKGFDHPQYGRNLRIKLNTKKKEFQNKITAKKKAEANEDFLKYSNWINTSRYINSLEITGKNLKERGKFNHPQYGRALRAKFNAKKRELTR